MVAVSKNFTREELACKHCGKMEIPQAAIDCLQLVREHMGIPLAISSGYRCPEYNAQVSKTGRTGPHTKAAFDIAISGPKAYQLMNYAMLAGFTGIGVDQKGPHEKRFIHLDDLPNVPGQPRSTVWSY